MHISSTIFHFTLVSIIFLVFLYSIYSSTSTKSEFLTTPLYVKNFVFLFIIFIRRSYLFRTHPFKAVTKSPLELGYSYFKISFIFSNSIFCYSLSSFLIILLYLLITIYSLTIIYSLLFVFSSSFIFSSFGFFYYSSSSHHYCFYCTSHQTFILLLLSDIITP